MCPIREVTEVTLVPLEETAALAALPPGVQAEAGWVRVHLVGVSLYPARATEPDILSTGKVRKSKRKKW